MENRSPKHFALIFLLGLLILSPQLFHLFRRQEPTAAPAFSDEQLAQLSKQRPYLLFQPIPVNSAQPEQLEVIPGIGPKLSRRIIAYRTEHGTFRSLEELDLVNGIGPQKLASLKEYCRL